MDFSLCFVCPARFCEITEDKDCSVAFLKNLVSLTTDSLPSLVTVDDVILLYSEREHMYHVRVKIHSYPSFEQRDSTIGDMKLQIEGNISQILLQCFWEVSAFGC